jgi:hypothetical protein
MLGDLRVGYLYEYTHGNLGDSNAFEIVVPHPYPNICMVIH